MGSFKKDALPKQRSLFSFQGAFSESYQSELLTVVPLTYRLSKPPSSVGRYDGSHRFRAGFNTHDVEH